MAQRDVDRVMALTRTDIHGPDFSVLVVLAWHVHEITGQCNPAYETIAREAHISRDTVYRSIVRLKELGVISVLSGTGHTSSWYVLNLGVGGEPSQDALRAQSAYSDSLVRPGRELPELNTSVSGSGSASGSVSVERVTSRQKTEDKMQKQQQMLGGRTPEPPASENQFLPACMELERVWKEVTKAPCYPRNFIPLLGNYTVQHIAAAIRWAFTVSNHWTTIKNTGAFCKQANGSFPVFEEVSRQYERYMQAVREGDAKKPRAEGASGTGVMAPPARRAINAECSRDRAPASAPAHTPLGDDVDSATRRCMSCWVEGAGDSSRPYQEYDFKYLLHDYDEDDILFAIRHFQEYEWWSEKIRNSGDFSDNFSEILAEVKPEEPPSDDEGF